MSLRAVLIPQNQQIQEAPHIQIQLAPAKSRVSAWLPLSRIADIVAGCRVIAWGHSSRQYAMHVYTNSLASSIMIERVYRALGYGTDIRMNPSEGPAFVVFVEHKEDSNQI